MSTYLYLICPHHEESQRSDMEVGQHTYDLPQIRFAYLRRDHWLKYIELFPRTLYREFDHLAYFDRNTHAFLYDHRECAAPYIEDENGGMYPIESPTIEALLSEEATNW